MADRFFRPILLLLVVTTLLAPGCQRKLTPAEDWHAFQMALGRTTADLIEIHNGFDQMQHAKSPAQLQTIVQVHVLYSIDRTLQELDKTHPQTADVRQVRDQYIAGFRKLRAATEKILAAFKQPGPQGMRTMNEAIQMARTFEEDMRVLKPLGDSLNQRYGRAVINGRP